MNDEIFFPEVSFIEKELAERSLHQFVKFGWKLAEPANAYDDGWHIRAICEHLEAINRLEIRNLIINIPPRHMKSLLVCVFWFAWTWIHDPGSRWMYSSYSEALAIRDSLKCRRIIQSDWYRNRWGDRFYLLEDQNVKSRFENNKLGYRLCSGVGGMGTGEGGDYIIVDDPIKERDSHSPLQRKNVNDWWDNTMSTRGNHPDKVRKVIIMQRLHQEDLTGHLLDKMRLEDGEKYEHLCLPAEYIPTSRVTSLGWRDPRTQIGQALWSERYPTKKLAIIKSSLSAYGQAGQLQQQPSPDGGGIFKRKDWQYWIPEGILLPPVEIEELVGGTSTLLRIVPVELPKQFDEIIQSWDLTFKDSITNDYICGIVVGRIGINYYILDLILERADINQTLTTIQEVSARWPTAYLKLIEDKANGPAVISLLRDKLSGLVPINPEGGKISRAHAASPAVASKHVFLPHPLLARWVDSFRESCAGFPNLAHDDDVDAFTQFVVYWNNSVPLIGVG